MRVRQFFIGLSDAPKYDIIRTENENLNDHFLEILTFKECSKCVLHVSNTRYTFFEHISNVNISGRKQSIKFSLSIQIMSYLGASDRPIKKLASSTFKVILTKYVYAT